MEYSPNIVSQCHLGYQKCLPWTILSLNLVLNSNQLLENYLSKQKKLTSEHSEVRALQDTTFAVFCTRFIHTAATVFSVAHVTALKIGSL